MAVELPREVLYTMMDEIEYLDWAVPFDVAADGTMTSHPGIDAPHLMLDMWAEPGEDVTSDDPRWVPMTGLSDVDTYPGACLADERIIDAEVIAALLTWVDEGAPATFIRVNVDHRCVPDCPCGLYDEGLDETGAGFVDRFGWAFARFVG